MRAAKLAIAAALRIDADLGELVPATSVYAVERATVPTLPSIEVIGVSSERVDGGPMIKHSMAIEVTVSHPTEDGSDAALDGIVRALRRRLSDAERSELPIRLESGEGVLIELGGTRWSVSATGSTGVIRGASITLDAEVAE